MSEILDKRVVELAELIRTRKLSPVEVVEGFIQQIERVNPRLNALVADRFEAALDDARAAEKRIKTGKNLPPLLGVPWTTKEMLSVEGMPNTAGSVHRRGVLADADAEVVRRVRSSGAINLGVSNQSEMGLWFESNNPIYGRTNNPWDLTRTAGGSSGGEGALVAAQATGFGMGSDMGGSIRIPAFYCGVYGHKPGKGRVPSEGHFPRDHSSARLKSPPSTRYISIGPMTRDARDLLPLFNVMAGTTEQRRALKGRKVFVLEDPQILMASTPCQEQRNAAQRAATLLKDAGMHAEEWSFLSFRDAMNIYTSALAEGADMSIQDVIGCGTRPRLRREIPGLFKKGGPHTAPAMLLSLSERFISPKPKAVIRWIQERDRMLARINQVLGEDAVLILPTLAHPAPKHNATLLRPFDIVYTALFNALELPVTAAPMGISSQGVPLGVQIVGAIGQDALTMSVAEALQDLNGRWLPPPPLSRS